MQTLQEKLKTYKFPEKQESKLQSFQEFALETIKNFGISKPYQSIIWKKAKHQRPFLEGKIALCVEKFGDKTETKGSYLIALLTKKPKWLIK